MVAGKCASRASRMSSARVVGAVFLRQHGDGKAAADMDAFKGFVVAVVGVAQTFGHFWGVVEVGYGGGEMRLARQQDVLGASRQVGPVFLRQHGDGKSVPAEGVGVAEIGFQLAADGCDPDEAAICRTDDPEAISAMFHSGAS